MFVVDEKCVHISLFPLSLSIRSILLAWLIRAPFHRHAGNTFAQYRVGRACPFLRRYPHLADFENAKKSIEVEEGTKNLIFHLLERSFFKTDRRRRIYIIPISFSIQSMIVDRAKKREIEIQRRELLKLFSSSKLVVSIFLTACSFFFFFSKGESDLCVAKAGEVCLLQGRATSWTTGPRCLCIRTCALSPYVCSR